MGTDLSATPLLAAQFGAEQQRVIVMDFDTFTSWLREPPALLPSSSQDQLRATARTPTMLR
jgi:hypothetical protein